MPQDDKGFSRLLQVNKREKTPSHLKKEIKRIKRERKQERENIKEKQERKRRKGEKEKRESKEEEKCDSKTSILKLITGRAIQAIDYQKLREIAKQLNKGTFSERLIFELAPFKTARSRSIWKRWPSIKCSQGFGLFAYLTSGISRELTCTVLIS